MRESIKASVADVFLNKFQDEFRTYPALMWKVEIEAGVS